MGTAGPVFALTIPSIRQKYFGYVPAERVPTTYPSELARLPCTRTVRGLLIFAASQFQNGHGDPFRDTRMNRGLDIAHFHRHGRESGGTVYATAWSPGS